MNYADPRIAEIYDLANPWAQDLDFYMSLSGKGRSSVLDLGCGTGTLCCALAQAGHQVTGVDPSFAMLQIAKRKPHANQVEWVESSAQIYRSERRFDLIVMTGHAFQTLLTDADAIAALSSMRRHLNDEGRIAFETRNPSLDWALEWDCRQRSIARPGGQILETLEVTADDGEFISFKTSYRLREETLSTRSRLRFPSREKVEELIACSGLMVRNVFGDWNAGPFAPDSSREIIFVAQSAM